MRLPTSKRNLTLLLFVMSLTSTVWAVNYEFKKGDTYSHVVGLNIPGPVWGKNGSFKNIIRLNPQIKNPDVIFPGEEINLGNFSITAKYPNSFRKPATETPEPTSEPVPKPPEDITNLSPKIDPTPTMTPQPHPQVDEAPPFKRYSYLVLTPQTYFTRLDGQDKTNGGSALLFSNLVFAFNLNWYFVWSERFRTFVHLGLREVSMAPASAGSTIDGANQISSKLGAGIEGDISEHLTLGLGFLVSQEIFLQAKSSTEIEIDQLALPEIESYLRYAVILTRPLGIGVTVAARTLIAESAGTYNTQLGYAYTGKLYLEQALSQARLGVDLFYDRSLYSTTSVNQQRTDLGLSFYLRVNINSP